MGRVKELTDSFFRGIVCVYSLVQSKLVVNEEHPCMGVFHLTRPLKCGTIDKA